MNQRSSNIPIEDQLSTLEIDSDSRDFPRDSQESRGKIPDMFHFPCGTV